ncbi:MAG: adenylate kinase [Candidatus Bathyarchaeia archaeon]
MRIVILGPPGSGKGTRARILGEICDVPVITTGDMLRRAVKRGDEVGEVAKGYMDRGELVPDGVVNRIMRKRLEEPDAKRGFILDGYPRSTAQADALDDVLEKRCQSLDHVIYVEVGDETIIRRLSNRRVCPECGEIYNLRSKPPKESGVCDMCDSQLIQRDDDRPDVIRRRLKVYRRKTEPLLERYRERGLIDRVSGDVKPEEIPDTLRGVVEC